MFTVNCIEKTKIKKKRPGVAHILKKIKKIDFSGLGQAMFSFLLNLLSFCIQSLKIANERVISYYKDELYVTYF